MFALTGGAFFAEVQRRSCALQSAGDCRVRGGDKKEGTPAVCLLVTDGTCEFYLITNVTVGCDKVNCPKGKRRCPRVRPRRAVSNDRHTRNRRGVPLTAPIPSQTKKMQRQEKQFFPASAVPGKTILAISSVVRGLPKRMIYFSSSVQSRASRMVVHFSYLSSLLLSEYAWLLVASCTAR